MTFLTLSGREGFNQETACIIEGAGWTSMGYLLITETKAA